MKAEVADWVPGTPYSKVTIRAADLPVVQQALRSYGVGIHYSRPLLQPDQRPPSAPDLDLSLFCFWMEPDRPLGAPEIKQAVLEVLRLTGVPAMADEVHA